MARVSIEELLGVYAEAVAINGPNSTSAKIASAMIVHEFDLMEAEVARLRDICLRAAGYIGVRQGPEVDEEADELMKMLRGET